MSSIQTAHIKEIHYIPLNLIRRPIQPVLDEDKIQSMISTIHDQQQQQPTTTTSTSSTNSESSVLLPPIDVLTVKHNSQTYYFGFGGCHRFQAYERAGLEKVPCKLVPCSKQSLSLYLGAGAERLFKDNNNNKQVV